MSSEFIHLHVHSEYSLDIGFFNVDDYVKFCYENKILTTALTERFNLCSVIKFYKKCKTYGIKPIIGSELFVENEKNDHGKFIFLCQNINGYRNLTKLIAKASLENSINGIPVIKKKWLTFLSEDLIVIALSFESDIGKNIINEKINLAKECLNFWKKNFNKRFYMSITKFGLQIEKIFFEKFLDFLEKIDIYLVATNEVCFLRPIELDAYKTKMAIFDSSKRIILDSDIYFQNRYYKFKKEMNDVFFDMPELLFNSNEISKICKINFELNKCYTPKYLKKINNTPENFLKKISFEKLFNKIKYLNLEDIYVYTERLIMEINVINKTGFANYFLVTQDFIVWAKNNNIFVGPGRGSGSGSLVAYLLSITDIDPIKYDLLFERFLNHERISIPDFDIDFCIEGRDLVFDYIFKEYGINNVAQIAVFACMTIKSVIRDVGRILGYSYGFVDKIVKLVSNNHGGSLKFEIMNNLKLKKEYDTSYDVQSMLDMSLKLEGLIKGLGKHAGGLVISPLNLLKHLPLSYEIEEYNFITQLDKIDIEAFGFIKFDFLGVKTLSIISSTIEAFSSYKSLFCNYKFDAEKLSENDNKTYNLIQNGDTSGIFQFESFGIKSILQKIKPNNFTDLVALVALYRPGPLQSGMLYSFVKRKIGEEKIDYIHPKLKCVLEDTYGIVVYQEQIMLIAQVFSNYSVSSADFLRIAMAKKNTEDMNIHLKIFSDGAENNGIDRNTSREVFFVVEKFAGYGFNKAHSVGYALLAYNSAWLKTNYNIFFLATTLSADMYNYDNIKLYIEDCTHFDIKIYKPDINRSFYCFTTNNNEIYYGLGALKGVGLSVISEIIHNRCIFGIYNCFFDFINRIDINLLSKKTLESLIYSGVFDKLYEKKFKLILISIKIINLYFKSENYATGAIETFMDDYFNYMIKNISYALEYKQEEITQKGNYLPEYFLKEFLNDYKEELNSITKLKNKSGNYLNIFFSGLISKILFKKIFQEKFIILEIINNNKKIELNLSNFKYKFYNKLIKIGAFVTIGAYFKKDKLHEIFIEDFYKFRQKFIECLDITFDEIFISDKFLKKFFSSLQKKIVYGKSILRFKIYKNGKYKTLNFKNKIKMLVHDELIDFFYKIKEIKKMEIIYKF